MDSLGDNNLFRSILNNLLGYLARFIKKKRSFKQWLLLLAALSFSCCCLLVLFQNTLESVGLLPTRTPTTIPVRAPTIEIPTQTQKPTRTSTATKTATQTRVPPSATIGIPTDTPGPPCNCYGPDLNCSDFKSRRAAQSCYDYCKANNLGDVFGLDSDGDGFVCESMP